jgi:hypothetical protein
MMRAFISYTHDKDEFNVVTELYKRFTNELGMLVPDAEVFRDREKMRPGERFPDELAKNLDATDVLLVLLSPKWLASDWCRWEYDRFTKKEREQHLKPRLLPVLWVEVDEHDISDSTARGIAKELKAILYDDWTKLRHANLSAEEPSSRIADLAKGAKLLAGNR